MEDCREELQSDPGMTIKYNVEEVHTTLAHPCSPVRQGQTSGEGLKNFETYVRQIICGACNVYQHCVRGMLLQQGMTMYKTCSTGCRKIRSLTLEQMSFGVSAPPSPPLGTIFKIIGSADSDKVTLEKVPMSMGVFRSVIH